MPGTDHRGGGRSHRTVPQLNLEAAQQTGASWAQTYPRDARPHNVLSGMVNKTFGNYENAKTEALKAIELDPDCRDAR
jgi:hypothetical protein